MLRREAGHVNIHKVELLLRRRGKCLRDNLWPTLCCLSSCRQHCFIFLTRLKAPSRVLLPSAFFPWSIHDLGPSLPSCGSFLPFPPLDLPSFPGASIPSLGPFLYSLPKPSKLGSNGVTHLNMIHIAE